MSYWIEEELVGIVSDPGLIADYRARVLEPMLAEALPENAARSQPFSGWRAAMLLGAAGGVLGAGLPISRTSVPWAT